MVKPIDLRLNAIVDPERARGRDLVALARQIAAGQQAPERGSTAGTSSRRLLAAG